MRTALAVTESHSIRVCGTLSGSCGATLLAPLRKGAEAPSNAGSGFAQAGENWWRVRTAAPATVVSSEEWLRFHALTKKWREERGFTSSISKMALCSSYQQIIGMGEKAVPLILRQLRDEGDDADHWFWALKMITGEDPVSAEAVGDTVQMAAAWFAWADERHAW